MVRALSGVFAAIAALIIWVIAVPVFDVELMTTDWQGKPMEIGPVQIILFSIGPALAGWASIALLERLTRARAKPIWTTVAIVVLLISFVPLSQMTAAAAVTLGLMHLAVGLVIIAAMRVTSGEKRAVAGTPKESASVPA
ncbi:MAG TPA: DUF6069 family protein [Candidatus Limnocylindrales bacterium]